MVIEIVDDSDTLLAVCDGKDPARAMVSIPRVSFVESSLESSSKPLLDGDETEGSSKSEMSSFAVEC